MPPNDSNPAPQRTAIVGRSLVLAFLAVALGALLFSAWLPPSTARAQQCDDEGECHGHIERILPRDEYLVRINDRHSVIATRSRRMRRYRIRLLMGDHVIVQLNPYDPNHGRITHRVR
jgi:translation initiation factor IF-1